MSIAKKTARGNVKVPGLRGYINRIDNAMGMNGKYLTWIFIGLTCFLLAPNLVYGIRESHDIKFHLTLLLSWRDALDLGILYPRWLPDHLHGLGSPALLIYPPFASAFFVLIDFLTFHALVPERVMGLGAVLLSLGSAATFYPWARQHVSARVALIAALFYATAPYHLNLDLYERGAMAEYAAFVWIPLIFLGIRTTVFSANARGVALLGVGVGALFVTHLLTAMLVAPLAAAYALVCLRTAPLAGSRIERFGLVTVTTMLGASLAAFYFVPATLLLPEANSDGVAFDVISSNIWFIHRVSYAPFWKRLLLTACSYLVIFLYLLAKNWRNRRRPGQLGVPPASVLIWAIAGILCFALMSGLFPFVFLPPSPYGKIQFVWRLLTVMEFSLISLFVCSVAAAQHEESRAHLLKAGSLVLLLLSAAQCANVVQHFHNMPIFDSPFQDSVQVKLRLSPMEYLPVGTKKRITVQEMLEPSEPYAKSSQPAFVASAQAKLIEATRRGAQFTVHSIAAKPTQVMIQQFYFPGWKAFDEHGAEIAVFRDAASHLASYIAPVGEHTIVLKRVPTTQERWGNIISLVGLGLFALLLVFLFKRGKSRSRISSTTQKSNDALVL